VRVTHREAVWRHHFTFQHSTQTAAAIVTRPAAHSEFAQLCLLLLLEAANFKKAPAKQKPTTLYDHGFVCLT
jgi:hypothetical protein